MPTRRKQSTLYPRAWIVATLISVTCFAVACKVIELNAAKSLAEAYETNEVYRANHSLFRAWAHAEIRAYHFEQQLDELRRARNRSF